MISLEVFPGSIEVISQALDKFGDARVSSGAWDEPVRINDLTAEEAASAQRYFEDMGCRVVETTNKPEMNIIEDPSIDGAAPDQIDQIKQEIGEAKLNAVLYTCISERAEEFLLHGHRTVYASDLKKRMEKQENLFLLDIRLSENFATGHIPGSINIEFIEVMEPNNLSLLPRDGTPIILICYTGHTASQVNSILNLLGYNAWTLRFGMMSWNARTLTGLWSSRQQQKVIGGGFQIEKANKKEVSGCS